MGLHSGLALSQTPVNTGLHPGLVLWLARISAQPTPNVIALLDTYLKAMRDCGALQQCDCITFFAGGSVLGATANLVTRHIDAVYHGDTSKIIAGQGVTGDGSSVYVDYNINLSTASNLKYALNNAHMAIYSLTAIGNSSAAFGALKYGNGNDIRIVNQKTISFHSNSSQLATVSVQSAIGYMGWSRSDANNVTFYKDGFSTTVAIPSTAIPNDNLYAFLVGSLPYDKNTLALAHFGPALTLAQWLGADAAAKALMAGLGAQVNENAEDGEVILPACFNPSDTDAAIAANPRSNGKKYRVYQLSAPPLSDSATGANFARFPGNYFSTLHIDFAATSTAQKVATCHHIWEPRMIVPPGPLNNRPNYMPGGWSAATGEVQLVNAAGLRCWPRFTTLDRAQAFLLCQILFSLGAPFTNPGYETHPVLQGYGDVCAQYGLAPPVPWWTAYNTRETLFSNTFLSKIGTYATVDDVPINPPGRLADIPGQKGGIVLDSEVQDGRTPAQRLALIQHLAPIFQHYAQELVIYPNVLTNWGAKVSGYDVTNLYQIHQTPNVLLCIGAWKQFPGVDVGAQVDAQEALLRGPNGDQPIDYSRLILSCAMGTGAQQLNAADNAALRTRIQRGYIGSLIFLDYAVAGGPLSAPINQSIATINGLPNS